MKKLRINKCLEKVKKEAKGITMIVLVVTIIVLLILSAVVISLTVGQNGLFSRSKQASSEHIKQEAREAMNLKITGIQIECYTEKQTLPDLQYLANKLCEDDEMEYVHKEKTKIASLDKIDVKDVNSIFTKIKKYPYEFEIDSELKLASIDGVKIAASDNTDLLGRIEGMEKAIQQLTEKNTQLESNLNEANSEIQKLKQNNSSAQKSIITATLNSTQTTTQASEKINFNKVYASVGDAFKLESGEIKIQKDISHVMVDVQIYVALINNTETLPCIDLYVNNQLTTYINAYSPAGWANENASSVLLNVKKGDSIKVIARRDDGSVGKEIYGDATATTYITVSEVN